MCKEMAISFGDNVRVLPTLETDEAGISGKQGAVYGETTPSSTGIEVIGEVLNDYAINVHFEQLDKSVWLAPELLEFVNHGEGTEIVIGNHRAVRRGDGSWQETQISTNKRWWQFWR